jgi:hypothetical protein
VAKDTSRKYEALSLLPPDEAPSEYLSDHPPDSNNTLIGEASNESRGRLSTDIHKRKRTASPTRVGEAEPEMQSQIATDSSGHPTEVPTNKLRLLGSRAPTPYRLCEPYVDRPSRLSIDDTERAELRKAGKKFLKKLQHRRFIVDYSKSEFEVYKDFLEFCVRHSHSLDMICLPWAPDPKEGNLPTWIPRLCNGAFERGPDGRNHRVSADSLVGRPGTAFKPYSAAKGYPAFWKPKQGDERCLITKGFELDTIKETINCAVNESIPPEWPEAGFWCDLQREPPPDPFWQTLVANRTSQGQPPPCLWRNACKAAFSNKSSRQYLDLGSIARSKCSLIMKEFVERVICVTFKRKLVVFKRLLPSDSIGLGPQDVAVGDRVCILYGCSVPVLLRRCEGDPNVSNAKLRHTFVGECYVHGMMDGEALVQNSGFNFKDKEEDFELI